MGLMRVFSKSIRFTVRSKRRFLVFMFIFAIVSSFVAFYIDIIDTMQTDEFLDQKGVVLEELDEFSVNYTQSLQLMQEIQSLESSGGSVLESSASYLYVDLDPTLRLFSIDVYQPWMNKDYNPTFMETGRFPNAENEIMVPNGSFQFRNSSSGVLLKSDIVIGQTLEFVGTANLNGNNSLKMEVVGTFDTGEIQLDLDVSKQLWIFMHTDVFEATLELYDRDINEAFTLSMSFTVPGLFLQPETYDLVDALNTEIKVVIAEGSEVEYGIWRSQPDSLPLGKAKEDAKIMIVFLAYAIGGGLMLSFFFSYLISRFRRPEIAVLKALGYSNAAVRLSLFAEILTTSFVGFVVGLSSAQAFLYFPDLKVSSLLRFEAISVSFLINVIVNLPGMWLVSFRILRVSPAEAFRDK